jgi:hypothetical protein
VKVVGKPVEFLDEPEGPEPIYDHPMDEILGQIQSRRTRTKTNIEISHVFISLAIVIIYLATL